VIVNRAMGVWTCHGGGNQPRELKEAILQRSGIIWTIVGVLLIIALLIYIF
jgi:hypothetical protein